MRNAKTLAAFYVGVLVLSATAVNLTRTGGPAPMPDVELAAALVPFDACDDALDYFTESAAEQAAAWSEQTRLRGPVDDMALDAATEEPAAPAPAPAAPEAGVPEAGGAQRAGDDFSATNIQEAGVDEPDLVKTDGRRIVTVADGRLQVVDVTGGAPRLTGSLALPGDYGQELLLAGDRALVFSTTWSEHPVAEDSLRSPAGTGQSVLTLVDLPETTTPQVASTLTIDGEYVSARMVDGVARVVLRSHPGPVGMPMPMPVEPAAPDGPAVPDEATEKTDGTEPTITEPTIDDWVPHYRLDSDTTVTDRLVDCEQIHRPVEPAGTGMVTVLSVDLAGQLEPSAATSVVADVQTVYASADTLYVAFTGWEQQAATQIHAFDISDPSAAVYRASGAVPGRLLNQWALSEHAGHLRVATTEGDSWGVPPVALEPAPPVEIDPGVPGGAAPVPRPVPPPAPSQSAVTVLAAQGDELVQVGRVEGLGPTERIYSVRFMGDVGYVVTFRETDPLYTLDLSDPADPRVVGELKILGYSAYLHPLGEGLLLGVGQDATEEGRLLGTQLSLFDVSDLANPTRTHQTTIPDARSGVEHDHRAFLHWPATGTIVLPLEIYSFDEATRTEDVFAGAAAFTVDAAAGFAEVGRVSHAAHIDEEWMGAIRRSLVVGDTLYTVSEAGLQAADLATLDERGWLAWR